MPDMVEQMYCSQQIAIPAMFPYILKQYAKAAIRTQPYDLLRWSASYFTAMANGETPPVKYRIEYPAPETASGLTPGYLRVLLKQLGVSGQVPMHVLYDKWLGVCLNESCLREMLAIGGFRDMVDWLHFVAVAAAHLTDSLAMTMSLCCELLTNEPEGGSAMIPCETFLDIYEFLARLECGPSRDPSSASVVETAPVFEPIIPISDDNFGALGVQECSQEEVEVPENTEEPGESGDPGLEEPDVEGEAGQPTEVPADDADADGAPPAPTAPPAPAKEAKSGESLGTVQLSSEEFDSEERLAVAALLAHSEESVHPAEVEVPVVEVEAPRHESVQTVPLSRHVPGIGPAVPGDQVARVTLYMRSWADRQEGMVMPRNIRHFLCPPLDSLAVAKEFSVDASQDAHDQSYLYPQRRPITCQDVDTVYN